MAGLYPVGRLVWAQLPGYPWWAAMVCNHPTLGKETRVGRVGREVHCMFLGEVSRAWVYKVRPWDQEATLGEEEEMEWGKMWHLGVEDGRRTESLSDHKRLEKLLVPLLVSDGEESVEEMEGLQESDKEQQVLNKSEKNAKGLKDRVGNVHGLKKSDNKKQWLKKNEEKVKDLKESRGLSLFLGDETETVPGESDHHNSRSKSKRVKSSRKINDQGEKSEYEKLRDANVAERRKAFMKSGLLEDIAKYKKDYLGKPKISSFFEGAGGPNTEKRVKGSQCKICQAQVPQGMMVMHKKYFHAKIKEPMIRCVTEPRKPKELLQAKCPHCYVGMNLEVLALHINHYHTPIQDIGQLGAGLTTEGQKDLVNVWQQGLAWMEKKKIKGQAQPIVRKNVFQPMGENLENIDISSKRNRMVLESKHGNVLPPIHMDLLQTPSQDPHQEPPREDQLLQEKKFLFQNMKLSQYKDFSHDVDSSQKQELSEDQDLTKNRDLRQDLECARERSTSTSEVSLPPAPSCSTSLFLPSPTGLPPLENGTVSCPLCAAVVPQKLMTLHVQHFHCETKVSQTYRCPHCPASFQGPSNLLTHVREATCRTKRELASSGEADAGGECIDLVSDEEGGVVKGEYLEVTYKKDKTFFGVKLNTRALTPPLGNVLKPQSAAQRTAGELERRGFSVSLVSPEQEQLQKVLRVLEMREREVAVLVRKARQVHPSGSKSLREELKKVLGPGLHEVLTRMGEV